MGHLNSIKATLSRQLGSLSIHEFTQKKEHKQHNFSFTTVNPRAHDNTPQSWSLPAATTITLTLTTTISVATTVITSRSRGTSRRASRHGITGSCGVSTVLALISRVSRLACANVCGDTSAIIFARRTAFDDEF